MNVLVKTRGGSLALMQSDSPTSSGYPYYRLEYQQTSAQMPVRFFIWQNELTWLCRSLSVLATCLDLSRFQADGLYPLLANLGPAGGCVWLAQLQSGTAHLTLRRYRDVWKTPQGEKSHTRYFTFDRVGKFPLQIRLPASFVQAEVLGDFARRCVAQLDSEAERLKQSLASAAQELEGLPARAFFQQVAVRLKVKNEFRQTLAFPGMPTGGAEVSVLREPAVAAALKACEQSRTLEEVSAELGQALDGRALLELLAWTQRYAPDVLRTGYILAPVEQRKSVAVKDIKVYAADPLLSALQPAPPEAAQGPERPVQPPQCTEQHMLAARKRGLSTVSVSTSLGQAALPSPEWATTIHNFLRPPAALRIHRWRVLQLMTMAVGMASNLPGGLDGEPLLDLQRLALLTHDTRYLFSEEDAGSDIRDLTERAHRQWRNLLQGRAGPLPLSELPKRGEAPAPSRRGRT